MEWACGGGTASRELLLYHVGDKRAFCCRHTASKAGRKLLLSHSLGVVAYCAKLAEQAEQRSTAFRIPLTQLAKSRFSSAQLFHLFIAYLANARKIKRPFITQLAIPKFQDCKFYGHSH
jgi:hypothetical protein